MCEAASFYASAYTYVLLFHYNCIDIFRGFFMAEFKPESLEITWLLKQAGISELSSKELEAFIEKAKILRN